MAGYVDYTLEVDYRQLQTSALATLVNHGLQLDPAGWLEATILAIMLEEATTRQVLVDFAAAAYRDHGRKIWGIQPIDAEPATAESTWTMIDDSGWTIPAGTIVTYPLTGNQRVAFELVDELTVAPGNTTATGVTLAAVVPGAAANGLPGVTLDRPNITGVASVVTTSETTGGVDAETPREYLDRLRDRIRLASDAAITARDFATFAVGMPVVGRARAIDLYDAQNSLPDQPGHQTLVIADDEGQPVSPEIKQAVQDFFDDDQLRIVNTIVHVEDPTYVAIAVDFTATAMAGAADELVEAAAIAAVEAHLDPGQWRTTGELGNWDPDTVVRYFEIVEVLQGTPGLHRLDSLTINGGTVDVDLAAGGDIAPLPDATVTGTVSPA